MHADRTGGSRGADITDEVTSAGWDGPAPDIAVVIATYQRAGYLRELLTELERQTLALGRFEVVVCDDGSLDDTWSVLEEFVRATPVRMRAVRATGSGRGPARARNAAIARSRAPVVAFTDDDCLPSPTWLAVLLDAFANGDDVVQGAVHPDRDEFADAGPWDKTLWVSGPTPWFETANIAYRRAVLDAVGGFDEDDDVSRREGGLAFGEDCLLGARALAHGARRSYRDDAVVHHRCVPGTFGDYLESRRRLVGFPALARRSEPISRFLVARMFLTKRTAAFDFALAGAIVALARRRPRWLLASLPYLSMVWPDARRRSDGTLTGRLMRTAQLAYGDAVGLAWLLRGTARDGRVVL